MHFKEQVNISFFMAQVIPALSREDANNCKGPGGFLPADPEERNCEYLLYGIDEHVLSLCASCTSNY